MRASSIAWLIFLYLSLPVPAAETSRVDFAYAFAPPHRLTVAMPDSGNKTLLDVQPAKLRMAWSYEDLTRFPPATFMTPATRWDLMLSPAVDGHPFANSDWSRMEGWLPALENHYGDTGAEMRFEVVGAANAAVVRITLCNRDSRERQLTLTVNSRSWGENPAWAAPGQERGDCLVAGWNERADRVLVLGLGADYWSSRADGRSPDAKTLLMGWTLKPGQTRTAWLVRPYRAYAADLPSLRGRDWGAALEAGCQTWRKLLGRTARFNVPDDRVMDAFRACLADLFIMREPLPDGRVAGEPGTEVYRAANAFESAVMAIALDQVGLAREAAEGYRMPIEMQEADGNWADPRGWGHLMWGGSGFKAWAALEHYRLTGDRHYLAWAYPHLAASSRWQESQRALCRGAATLELYRGLMPRGMGDCGLKDDDDLYGVFLPHNIWAVYADRLSVEAAEILGKKRELPELRRIYETGRRDLLAALDRGAIVEKDYRWIPGVPGKTSGSRWGSLNVLFPCGVLPADHPLLTGTLRHIEASLSPGGIPLNTGWLANGMWVAITLDNLAEVHLAMDDGDTAARYFYACLNHGTPLFTWCEERGPEAGTKVCTGDRQHLWTPVAVVRCLRDMLVMEQADTLHLARGTDRAWLGGEEPVGVAEVPTHFGRVTYSMKFDRQSKTVSGEVDFARHFRANQVQLHIRLPSPWRVQSVNSDSEATLDAAGSTLNWERPTGRHRFVAPVSE